ncbi:MAG: DNA methyltransferase, partial [Gaiellaceae bacterium]
THGTFEAYCRERWGFTPRHGRRLIEAAQVTSALGPIGPIPTNEAQARELAPLLDRPDELVDVVRELRAEYGDDLTAVRIRRVVHNRMRRMHREQNLAERRAEELAKVLSLADRYAASDRCRVDVGDLRSWRPSEPVDAILTDPPYITSDAIELHSAVADLAVEVLRPSGALVVMSWQPLLAEVLGAMRRPELEYRWTLAWTFDLVNANTPNHQYCFYDRWKPLLVFYKPPAAKPYCDDIIRSGGHEKALHPWQQGLDGFEKLVRFFSRLGELVCDPFAGSGTTGVAALRHGRRFIGCDVDATTVEIARARLAGEAQAA